jgi:hypothetical protein
MVGVVTEPVNPQDLDSALLPWLVQAGAVVATPALAVSPPA